MAGCAAGISRPSKSPELGSLGSSPALGQPLGEAALAAGVKERRRLGCCLAAPSESHSSCAACSSLSM